MPVVATTMSRGSLRQRSVAARRPRSSSSGTILIAGPYITFAPRRCRATPNSSRRRAAVMPIVYPASGSIPGTALPGTAAVTDGADQGFGIHAG